jgi:hypothetical protein
MIVWDPSGGAGQIPRKAVDGIVWQVIRLPAGWRRH